MTCKNCLFYPMCVARKAKMICQNFKNNADFINIKLTPGAENVIKVCNFILDERSAEDIPLNEFCSMDDIKNAALTMLKILKSGDENAQNT